MLDNLVFVAADGGWQATKRMDTPEESNAAHYAVTLEGKWGRRYMPDEFWRYTHGRWERFVEGEWLPAGKEKKVVAYIRIRTLEEYNGD